MSRRVKRVGDITGQPPTNKAVDTEDATRLANLLEGLEFPATKEEIRRHVSRRPTRGKETNSLMKIVNSLDDRKRYQSTYDIELAAGLVEAAGAHEPYVRDKALNKANYERLGETLRPDPYGHKEKIKPASRREASPNTPPGEEI